MILSIFAVYVLSYIPTFFASVWVRIIIFTLLQFLVLNSRLINATNTLAYASSSTSLIGAAWS